MAKAEWSGSVDGAIMIGDKPILRVAVKEPSGAIRVVNVECSDYYVPYAEWFVNMAKAAKDKRKCVDCDAPAVADGQIKGTTEGQSGRKCARHA